MKKPGRPYRLGRTGRCVVRYLRSDLFWVGINSDYNEKELYGRTISVKEAELQFKNQMNYILAMWYS
jgi:hypothetical protein